MSEQRPDPVGALSLGRSIPLRGRVAVISPHLDDAVLSLGAALSAHVRRGGGAVAVTVLAGDVSSSAPPGPWDASARFTSEGAAARARRAEDQAACSRLGLEHLHVDGTDEQYRGGDVPAECWRQIEPVLDRCDELLLPGFPLRQRDHRAVTSTVLRRVSPDRPVRLYVEEPYALRERGLDPVHVWGPTVRWHPLRTSRRDAVAKLAAVSCYRSQIPLLGPGRLPAPSKPGAVVLLAQLWHAARARGEWVTEPVPVGVLSTALALHGDEAGD